MMPCSVVRSGRKEAPSQDAAQLCTNWNVELSIVVRIKCFVLKASIHQISWCIVDRNFVNCMDEFCTVH